jgi:hypothetical protein
MFQKAGRKEKELNSKLPVSEQHCLGIEYGTGLIFQINGWF